MYSFSAATGQIEAQSEDEKVISIDFLAWESLTDQGPQRLLNLAIPF